MITPTPSANGRRPGHDGVRAARPRLMMHFRSETMRFSREHVDGEEQFTVTWLTRGATTPALTIHFAGDSQFREWLRRDQAYSQREADEAIAQLRTRPPLG